MDGRDVEGKGAGEAPDESRNGVAAARAEVSDRSLQIRIAGVVQLIIGTMAAGLALLILAFSGAAPHGSEQAQKASMMSAVLVYSAVGAFFIVTGIEALRLRRWVRPVLLSLMWPSLVMGVLMLVFLVFMIPVLKSTMESSGATGQVLTFGISCMFAIIVIIAILIPLTLVGLYHGEPVRRYLEYVNTSPCWADAAPLPVFGMALWIFLTSLSAFVISVMAKLPYVLLFGRLITGPLLISYVLLHFLIGMALAQGLYRMRPWSWWAALASSLFLSAATVMNALFPPPADQLTSLAGINQTQASTYLAMTVSLKTPTLFMTIASALLILSYIVYIRRFFTAGEEKSQAGGESSPVSRP